MPRTLKIASWNIAGGRKMKTLNHFDYEEEDATYFAEQLAALRPDIVCLQEVHTNAARSVAHDIAKLLRFPYVYNETISPSHIDDAYQLGCAILSKRELAYRGLTLYPYPSFPLYFSDGREAAVHHKGIQVVELDGVTVANTQMLPLTIFGHNYDKGEGMKLARQIDTLLTSTLNRPLIFCGDINYDHPAAIYPKTYAHFSLREALPNELTRPNREGIKKMPDHIAVSSELEVVASKIVVTQSDHYLCFAEILAS